VRGAGAGGLSESTVTSVNGMTGAVVVSAADVGADPAGTASSEIAATLAASRLSSPWFTMAPTPASNAFFDLTGVFWDLAMDEVLLVNATVALILLSPQILVGMSELSFCARRDSTGAVGVVQLAPSSSEFSRFGVQIVADGGTPGRVVMQGRRLGTDPVAFKYEGRYDRNVFA
jgi:hypothetical protein